MSDTARITLRFGTDVPGILGIWRQKIYTSGLRMTTRGSVSVFTSFNAMTKYVALGDFQSLRAIPVVVNFTGYEPLNAFSPSTTDRKGFLTSILSIWIGWRKAD